MAPRLGFSCTLSQKLADGSYLASAARTVSDTAAMTTLETSITSAKTSITATEAAVATLEADGATPTQAHVTALRSVWNTTSAAITAITPTPVDTIQAADATLDINPDKVLDNAALKIAVASMLRQAATVGF